MVKKDSHNMFMYVCTYMHDPKNMGYIRKIIKNLTLNVFPLMSLTLPSVVSKLKSNK